MKNRKSPALNDAAIPQNFTIAAPEALCVQLVGDFTEWRTRPISLRKGHGGSWSATVSLRSGSHRYRFIVDGEWRDDPNCQVRVPNGYGTSDSVRLVKASNVP